jgi:hypothetical protein
MEEYEIYKKLYDNGFPQKNRTELEIDGNRNVWFISDGGKEYFVPLLSELIDACNGKFGALLAGPVIGVWTARGNGVEVHSSSREEAVARLWLELNKK